MYIIYITIFHWKKYKFIVYILYIVIFIFKNKNVHFRYNYDIINRFNYKYIELLNNVWMHLTIKITICILF